MNYNGISDTIELLNSIRRFPYPNTEIFVVDNASKENPEEYLLSFYPDVKFIRSEKNLGFAGGNNLAVTRADGDYLFFINNDAEVTENCLEKLVLMFDKIPNLGAVSPLICYYAESDKLKGDLIQYAGMTAVNPLTARNKIIGEKTRDTGQFQTPQPTSYAHGAAMMVKREIIEKVGKMDDKFFLYYEELDWCERIRKAGYEIYVEPNARVYHKESASVGESSTLKTYYLNRNRIFFMRRNFSNKHLIGFSAFLAFATIPKNLYTFFITGRFKHIAAFTKALSWNIKDMLSKSTSNSKFFKSVNSSNPK